MYKRMNLIRTISFNSYFRKTSYQERYTMVKILEEFIFRLGIYFINWAVQKTVHITNNVFQLFNVPEFLSIVDNLKNLNLFPRIYHDEWPPWLRGLRSNIRDEI